MLDLGLGLTRTEIRDDGSLVDQALEELKKGGADERLKTMLENMAIIKPKVDTSLEEMYNDLLEDIATEN